MTVCLEFIRVCLKECMKTNLELHCIILGKKEELLKLSRKVLCRHSCILAMGIFKCFSLQWQYFLQPALSKEQSSNTADEYWQFSCTVGGRSLLDTNFKIFSGSVQHSVYQSNFSSELVKLLKFVMFQHIWVHFEVKTKCRYAKGYKEQFLNPLICWYFK